MSKKHKILLTFLFIIPFFSVYNAFAMETVFKVTNIEVKNQSDGVIINDVSLNNELINNDIILSNKDDYVKYNITIQNTDEKDYTIKTIQDDNDSEYLKYTYDNLSNTKITAGEQYTFALTLSYIKESEMQDISNKEFHLILTYEDDKQNIVTEDIVIDDNNSKDNPNTSDKIELYLILGIILSVLIFITILIIRKKKIINPLMLITIIGTMTISLTVKSENINYQITFNNKINRNMSEEEIIESTNLILNKTNVTLNVGDSEMLVATIIPNNTTNQNIIWTSSDPSIVKVSSNGHITALKEGVATITATTNNGKEASCIVESVINENVYVHFYNTGVKSDAIFIKSGDKTMVIDGGLRNKNNNFVDYLTELGNVNIDYYVGTHGHPDHVGIAGEIIKKFNIKTIYVPKGDIPSTLQDSDNSWYTETENEAYNGVVYKNYTIAKMLEKCSNKEERLAIETAEIIELDIESPQITLSNSIFTVLNPFTSEWPSEELPAYIESGKSYDNPINTNSLVLRMDSGDTSFLFAADVSSSTRNNKLAKIFGELFKADVYKNGHHHYRLLTVDGKLKDRYSKISPDYVVMSADNKSEFEGTQVDGIKNVYSVNCGTVIIKSDRNQITVEQGHEYYEYIDGQKTVCHNLITN